MTSVSLRRNDYAPAWPFCCCTRFSAPLSHETAVFPARGPISNPSFFNFLRTSHAKSPFWASIFLAARLPLGLFSRTSHALAPFFHTFSKGLFVALCSRHLGPSWGRLGAVLRHLGAVLGLSWPHLRPFWGRLGDISPFPRAVWGHLGVVLAPSSAMHLLGTILGPSSGRFGTSWSRLGGILGHLGAVLGPFSTFQ